MEEIIGGYPALQQDFQYHAAIVGKYNFSYHTHLLCSAGILKEDLLISAGRCFIYLRNTLRKITFFAVAGVDELLVKNIVLHEINEIYTYRYNHLRSKNDIAIARLKYHFYYYGPLNLRFLQIPPKDATFEGKFGIVSGFGLDMVKQLNRNMAKEQIRFTTTSGLLLRYANVSIIKVITYAQFYNAGRIGIYVCRDLTHPFVELCGIIKSDMMFQYRGTCMGDNGAPLVIGNEIVGLVSIHNLDCDDTSFGTIYTKVSNHKDFIDAIKEGRILNGTTIHPNPIHLMRKNTLPESSEN